MLWCKADRIFLSADQVLAKISPNVSVVPVEPGANPLGHYLASLAQIRDEVPDDVLVLACHNLPFRGLHARVEQLEAHHLHRCDLIAAAAQGAHQLRRGRADHLPPAARGSASAAALRSARRLAHLNYMLRIGAPLTVRGSNT